MIYTIENEKLEARISSLGCTLVSLVEKESGTDVVLGFDSEGEYLLNYDPHFGAVVGRNANRIAKGQFEIDGVKYQLNINNGPNSLHSGFGDFSFRGFKLVQKNDYSITFFLEDNDMTGGFPGNLKVAVNYTLKDDSLILSFSGLTDKNTIFNLTNHSYFTLNGGTTDVLNHELKIYTNKVSLNDADGMATLDVIDTDGTSFDFTDFKKLKDNFALKHENLANGGLDHNFVFESLEEKDMACLRNENLELTVNSDLPDMHIYSACFLADLKGKQGNEYHQYYGIALECDYYPNAINTDNLIKPIIEANKEVNHYIKYTIRKR